MALENIIKKIKDDAQSEADNIVSVSKSKVDEYNNTTEYKAKKDSEQVSSDIIHQAELDANRKIASANLKKQKEILNTKQDLINICLDSTKKDIYNTSETLRMFMKKLLRKNINGQSTCKIQVSSTLSKKIELDKFKQELTQYCSKQGKEINFVFSTVNDTKDLINIVTNSTSFKNLSIDTAFRLNKLQLSSELNNILFKDNG